MRKIRQQFSFLAFKVSVGWYLFLFWNLKLFVEKPWILHIKKIYTHICIIYIYIDKHDTLHSPGLSHLVVWIISILSKIKMKICGGSTIRVRISTIKATVASLTWIMQGNIFDNTYKKTWFLYLNVIFYLSSITLWQGPS